MTLLGALQQDSTHNPEFSDCACRLYHPEGGLLFWDAGEAWMNIEGQDRMLKADQGFGIGSPQLGHRHRDEFNADGVRIQIDWVVTSVCSAQDEGCEFTEAEATITATRGSLEQKISAKGGCGC